MGQTVSSRFAFRQRTVLPLLWEVGAGNIDGQKRIRTKIDDPFRVKGVSEYVEARLKATGDFKYSYQSDSGRGLALPGA